VALVQAFHVTNGARPIARFLWHGTAVGEVVEGVVSKHTVLLWYWIIRSALKRESSVRQ